MRKIFLNHKGSNKIFLNKIDVNNKSSYLSNIFLF